MTGNYSTLGAASSTPNVGWLLDQFAAEASGLTHAVIVSLDGLQLATSTPVDRDLGDQLAALTAGLLSLSNQFGKLLALGGTDHVALRLSHGHLLCMRIGESAGLMVAAAAGADLRVLAYQMSGFVTSVAHALAPPVRAPSTPNHTTASAGPPVRTAVPPTR